MKTITKMRLRIKTKLNRDQAVYYSYFCKQYGFRLHHVKNKYWITR